MKVLMATMKLDIGGAETHIVELSKALKRRGVDVYVASAGGAYEKELTEAGIKHIYVPMSDKNTKDVISSYKILKDFIKENDIDVVHGHARIPCFILNLIRKTVKFRFVTTAHWVFSLKFPYKYITKWGDRSLAVSDDIKKYLIDNYGIAENNIRVTINGIDTEKFSKDTDYSEVKSEFSLSDDKRRIVYVSRMDTDRSYAAHKLIEIAETLNEKIENLEILIVGGGNDFENIKSKADAINQKLNKTLIKYTDSRTDINKLVASGEIFVGVSRAALEAMAAEKPSIIAGNEGYIGIFDESKLKTSIDTNFCCRGCGQTTTDRLMRDILTLMNMPKDELKKLGEYSKSVVEKYYSVKTMADDAMKMYTSVIKNTPINSVNDDEIQSIDSYLANKKSSKRHDVMISGYYGFGNSGDDSILKAIISNLKEINPDINIIALSSAPGQTKELYGVDSIHRFDFLKIFKTLKDTSLLISGGGSLIQDVTSDKSLAYYLLIIRMALFRHTKVMLYANGIGPITNPHNHKKVKDTLNRVDLITLREHSSLNELQKIGVNQDKITVTADPAFTLMPVDDERVGEILKNAKIDGDYICISVRPWQGLGKDFENAIADISNYVKKSFNMDSLIIPMQCPKDTEISNRIALKSPYAHLSPENLTPSEILGLTKHSSLIIGMRLHTLIYAAAMGTPMIGLDYDPKITAVMDEINQHYTMPVNDINPITLKRYTDEILSNQSEIRKNISVYSKKAIEMAKHTAKLANDMIKS